MSILEKESVNLPEKLINNVINESKGDARKVVNLIQCLSTYENSNYDLYKFIWVEENFHSGLLFHDVTNDTAILYRFIGYDDYGNIINDQLRKVSFEMNEESQWRYLIETDQLDLPSGEYRIVPYFLIDHDFIPQGMINHMGG